MKKFISVFNPTGICELKMELLVKNWKDNFSVYISDSSEIKEWRFAVDGKKGGSAKVTISDLQAMELIERLGLSEIKPPMFNNRIYRTKSFIQAEIVRGNEQLKENLIERNILNRNLIALKSAIAFEINNNLLSNK